MTDTTYDLIVVGGGAAGFYGALTFAEATDAKRVLILERSRRVLQKVKISGGGRCNVTHDTDDRRWLSTHYPRGEKALIGPFHRHGPMDVVAWFERHGVKLKTESDGRMFPVTDDSQTVVDCLRDTARKLGVEIRTKTGVTAVSETPDGSFRLECDDGEARHARALLLATGGIRTGCGAALARSLGHSLEPAVPSLFTFQIDDALLRDLPGVSVDDVALSVDEARLSSTGPLLITHAGLSGPAVLKLSAWGARALYDLDYCFDLTIDWLPREDAAARLKELASDSDWGRRQIASRSPFPQLPRRLWRRFTEIAGIPDGRTWAECPAAHRDTLARLLSAAKLKVRGQSVNKDEFVTCGGVRTDEVDMRTMESRITPGLYFAGELLDIDGITGGFNFQSAWTTGYLAGIALAERVR